MDIADKDAIYRAIGTLKDARGIIEASVYGTADPKYDWVKGCRVTIEEAEAAYNRL